MRLLLLILFTGCATAGTPDPCSPAVLTAIESATLAKYASQCDEYSSLDECPATPAIKAWRTSQEKEAGCR